MLKIEKAANGFILTGMVKPEFCEDQMVFGDSQQERCKILHLVMDALNHCCGCRHDNENFHIELKEEGCDHEHV